MNSSLFQRLVVVAAGLGLVAAATATTPSASAKPDDESPPVLDLIAQSSATTSGPAVITLGIDYTQEGSSLRVRLYEPVTTRAQLWDAATGSPPTSESASWEVDSFNRSMSNTGGLVVSVPVILPEGTGDASSIGAEVLAPRPLHIELTSLDGTSIDTLRTFLLPIADPDSASPVNELAVAVVVDLRMPPAHSADGDAILDQNLLSRVLDTAQVLIGRPDVPLTVHINPETLDALALVGDDDSLSILRSAIRGRQLLLSPWTSLDIDDWIRADRADVVIDGLERSREALRWAGLEASTVMRFDLVPSPGEASLVTDPAAGVSGFVGGRAFRTPLVPPDPVTVLVDAAGDSHLMAQADPLLEAALRNDDPELGAQWVFAELARLGHATGESQASVVVVSAFLTGWDAYNLDEGGSSRPFVIPGADPAAAALLLDGLVAQSSLRPVTVDSLLAETAPPDRVTGHGQGQGEDPSFNLYLARRTEVEARLHAYESLLGDEGSLTAPLRTLLAVSASSYLTNRARTDLLTAVGRRATQAAAGVEFVERGRVTITERSADLPVTLFNNRSAPLTVAVELSSDGVSFPDSDRAVFRLEPGRNDLSVPIEARASGHASIAVTVTTPDDAGTITLTTGTLRVRYVVAEGLGFLILIVAAAVLATWWLRTLRKRAREADTASATVAANGAGALAGGNQSGDRHEPPANDDTRT